MNCRNPSCRFLLVRGRDREQGQGDRDRCQEDRDRGQGDRDQGQGGRDRGQGGRDRGGRRQRSRRSETETVTETEIEHRQVGRPRSLRRMCIFFVFLVSGLLYSSIFLVLFGSLFL